MSLHTTETLKCPQCGHSQEVLLWQSLNVSIDPDEQRNLLEGKINMFECAKCGNKAFVDTPFDYHDMHLEFYVKYIPFRSLEDADTFSEFLNNGFPSMEGYEDMEIPENSYWRTIHVVFDMGELVRYVIFRERLAEIRQKNA